MKVSVIYSFIVNFLKCLESRVFRGINAAFMLLLDSGLHACNSMLRNPLRYNWSKFLFCVCNKDLFLHNNEMWHKILWMFFFSMTIPCFRISHCSTWKFSTWALENLIPSTSKPPPRTISPQKKKKKKKMNNLKFIQRKAAISNEDQQWIVE